MSAELGTTPEPVGWVGNRNFIVPPDIIPVRRVSPIPKKKRTLCRPRPDGEPICRAGNREWFSDRLFVDSQTPDFPTACGTSMTAHASCLIGLLLLLAGQPGPAGPVRVSSPLRMPAFVAVIGAGGAGSGPKLTRAAPKKHAALPAKGRVAKAETPKKSSTVPSQPPTVAPEARPNNEPTYTAADARVESNEDTKVDASDAVTGEGAASGGMTAGGNGDGAGSGGAGTAGVGGGASGVGMSPGPYRLGNGVEPPRKIKDVRPIYPSGALASRTLGAVIIEAVVGADGKVHDAKVIHSVPPLDQAALEAVQQWEFAPSRLNGVAVAVIVTVLVQFSIY